MPKAKQETLTLEMIGRFPKRWPTKTMSEVCRRVTDGTHDSPKPTNEGFPLVTGKAIKNRRIDFTNTYNISGTDHQKVIARSKPERDDILFANIGNSIGDLVRVDTDCEFSIKNVALFKPDKSTIVPRFLEYYLFSDSVQAFVKGSTRGSAQPFIGLSSLRGFPVPVPPLDEQLYIAKVLGELDDKIQLNHQINQTLEQMAQAIFKSWFVDFEPVKAKIAALETGGSEEDALLAAMQAISGKGEAELTRLQAEQPEQYAELRATAELFPSAMQDSELGEIPEGWECSALDQIAKYQNGLALQKFRPENEDDYLPVVKIAQLKKGYADHEEKASPNIKPDCIIDNGDIVFSWSGSLMVDTWCGGRAALNQHLFKVTSENYPKWLYFHFTRHHLEEFQRIAADKAVTMGHIKREHLKRALCAIPNRQLIENAGKFLGNLLDKQIELRLESTTLSDLRDTLLPKLLSGELKTPALEI